MLEASPGNLESEPLCGRVDSPPMSMISHLPQPSHGPADRLFGRKNFPRLKMNRGNIQDAHDERARGEIELPPARVKIIREYKENERESQRYPTALTKRLFFAVSN